MSFLNIKDINKRDEIVKNFLSLQKQIQTRDRMEKMGEIGREEALSKFFKSVTTGTEQLGKKLTEEIGKIAKPATSTEPETGALPPSIDKKDDGELYTYDDPELNVYLRNIQRNKTIQTVTTEKGVYLKIANQPLVVTKNNIKYMGSEYKRTPELMELIFSSNPPPNSKSNHPKAYQDFKNMMRDADILLQRSPDTGGIIVSKKIGKRGDRWVNLLSVVAADLKQEQKGDGLLETAGKLIKKHHQAETKAKEKQGKGQKTIILSSDPLALADRLSLLCGSVKAGNTGLKNEIVEVCNELIRKKLMSRKERDELLNSV